MMDVSKIVKEVACDDCCLVFSNYKQFLLHRRYHTSLFQSLISEEILLEESCPLCLVKFLEKYKGRCLEKLLGSGKSGELSEWRSTTKSKCDAEFYCVIDYRQHSKEIHSGDRPLECEQREYTAARYYDLKQNIVSHVGEYTTKERPSSPILKRKENERKSDACPYCGEKFTDSCRLKEHLKIHFPTPGTSKCHLCSKVLASKASLRVHLKSHYKMFKCHLCEKEYSTRAGLSGHLLSSHKDFEVKSHNCSQCSKRFATPFELRRHVNIHAAETSVCQICSEELPKRRLEDHIARHNKALVCKICSKDFASRNSLLKHMHIHSEQKPFSCTYCDIKFSWASSLKKHQDVHFDKRPLDCKDCGYRFVSEEKLQKHRDPEKESKNTLHCKKCPKTFKNLNCFVCHERSHREFLCTVCNKTYFTLQWYHVHLKEHGIAVSEDSDSVTETKKKRCSLRKKFKCPQCPKKYPRKKALQCHLLKHDDKTYDCKHCGRQFLLEKSLKVHLSPQKETKRRLACSGCSKTFKNINCLMYHKYSHRKEFLCEVCNAKCFSPHGFKRHMARHEPNSESAL